MNRERLRIFLHWFQAHALSSVLFMGLVLRIIGIQSRDLQYDDAFSIFLSTRSLPEIVSGTAADTMPPLYYFLLHFWMLISREVWFMRALSVLLSLLVIAVLYKTVERWMGRGAAGWAGLLAAISPLQIYHGQDIRMYAVLELGQISYLWFFTRIWFRQEKPGHNLADWFGLVVSGIVSMYSHNLAVFGLIAPSLFLLVNSRWRLFIRLCAAQLAIGIGSLPWLLLLPGQMQKIQRAFWTPRPGLVEIIQALIQFTASLPLPSVQLAIAAILTFQVLILIGLILVRNARGYPGQKFFLIAAVVPPVMLFAASYLMRPVFVARGFLISSLAYYGLAGLTISCAWSRGAGKLIAGGFILAAVISLPSFYSFDSFPRSPFRQASAYLTQVEGGQAKIVHETKLSYFPMHFTAPGLPQVFLADMPGSVNDTFAPQSQAAMQIFPQPGIEQAAGDSQNLYFITFQQVFLEYQAMGIQKHPIVQWLSERYRLADQKAFNDLEIYHFVR